MRRQFVGEHRLLEVLTTIGEHVLHCGAQMVTHVVAQEAKHAFGIATRHERIVYQSQVSWSGRWPPAQPDQFIEQAARVNVARHRLRQRLEAGGLTLTRQFARPAARVAVLGSLAQSANTRRPVDAGAARRPRPASA